MATSCSLVAIVVGASYAHGGGWFARLRVNVVVRCHMEEFGVMAGYDTSPRRRIGLGFGVIIRWLPRRITSLRPRWPVMVTLRYRPYYQLTVRSTSSLATYALVGDVTLWQASVVDVTLLIHTNTPMVLLVRLVVSLWSLGCVYNADHDCSAAHWRGR